MSDIPFRSNNWSQADLAQSMATQRPVSAQPLNIPLTLKPNPSGTAPRMSSLERSVALQEQAARNAEFQAQRAREQARQQEVFKNEQARRDQLRNRTPTGEPQTPRITDRNPAWEQPTPTSKKPTQPGTPNPASPPTTPNGSGTRTHPRLSPTATPSPGTLLKELPPPSAKPATMRPSSLPTPAAGIYGGAAIGAGIDAGFRIAAGQPAAQVGFGAAGNFAGSLAGAVAGSAFGPVGAFVGGMIGGFVGGMIGDFIYNQAFPRPAFPPPEPYNGSPPFIGGQASTLYKWALSTNLNPADMSITPFRVSGPVSNLKITVLNYSYGTFGSLRIIEPWQIGAYPEDQYPRNELWNVNYGVTFQDATGQPVTGSAVGRFYDPPKLVLERADGLPDINGSLPGTIPTDSRSPGSLWHPGNSYYAPPRAVPEAQKNPAPNNYATGGTTPSASPRGDSPNWVPHAFPEPRRVPNPNTTPSNLGGELPQSVPTPGKSPASTNNPSSNPSQNPTGNPTDPGSNPEQATPSISIDIGPSPKPPNFGDSNAQPVPLGSGGSTTIPSGLPTTKKQEPTPDAGSPTPKNQNPTNFIPPLFIPNPTNTPTNNPTNNPLSKEDTKTAVCELTAPDACLGQPLNNIQNKTDQNGNKLDQLNALLNGLDLAGLAQLNSKLDTVNAKLGAQVPGGLSGKLERIAKWLHLDRILNILIWWQTLHNAYMLSANLGQTLTSAISNVLAVIGIKDAEGSPLDIGEILGNQFDTLAKTVIGETEWGSIKAEWKKWNRIYQAAANLMNSIQSIGYSILSALEVVGSWVASIGNALRKWGEVGESAYRWMNPTPNFQNKFFTTLENVDNVVSQVDQVASEILSAQETVTQIGEQKEAFEKALKEDDDSKQGKLAPEATKVKAAADESRRVSVTGLAITDNDKEPDE